MNFLAELHTLKNNYEFRRAYNRGKSFQSPPFITYLVPNRLGFCRVGITTSKKIGNAVQRNRARRVIRAAFAAVAPEINKGVDLVFVARSRVLYLKSTELEKIMRKHLQTAGVIR